MRIIVWIISCFCVLPMKGQDDLGGLALKYPFLDTSANHLQFYGSEQGMAKFYEKLDRVIFEHEGKINVVHVGGSHVQGGTLSHTLRRQLGQLAPSLNVERGFFFPYKLANTNTPSNLQVNKIGSWEGCRNSVSRNNCPWGFSGIDAITRDVDAGFELQSFSERGRAYGFTELRLFEHVGSSNMEPIGTPSPDSVFVDTTVGIRFWYFNEVQESISIHFNARENANPQYTLQGVQMLREEPGLVYHSLGVNGASTYSFLRSENFIEQGKHVGADLVIFGLGINDAHLPADEWHPEKYKVRYDTLVSWFREINPDCQFIFMTNNDSYYKRRSPNKNALDVQKVMKELSKDHDAAYWDLFEVMGGLNSISIWQEQGLASSDKIHFTNKGYRLNATLLFWALWEDYESHLQSLAP